MTKNDELRDKIYELLDEAYRLAEAPGLESILLAIAEASGEVTSSYDEPL